MTDLSKLAAGLSDAQRRALLMVKPGEALIALPGPCRSLAINGLMECHLTPLGQSLSAYLKDTHHG